VVIFIVGGLVGRCVLLQMEIDKRVNLNKLGRGGREMGKRRRISPEKKVELLREHLKNGIPVSEICEEYGIHPNVFYRWEKEFFEGGIETFTRKKGSRDGVSEEKALRGKIKKLNEVISWLSEENIKLKKKENGEL
jgi:transposase